VASSSATARPETRRGKIAAAPTKRANRRGGSARSRSTGAREWRAGVRTWAPEAGGSAGSRDSSRPSARRPS
jgi:hypothetical protein